MDGNAITPLTGYNAIAGTDYVGGYVLVDEGSHTMRHTSPISLFGGYLYGHASMETYGFSAGMRLVPINTGKYICNTVCTHTICLKLCFYFT